MALLNELTDASPTIEYVQRSVFPAAYGLLPGPMASPAASAMLLAIGLQESRFVHRRQVHGPARGFWQFELGGVNGVLLHGASRDHAAAAMDILRYRRMDSSPAHAALEHNDVLAAIFARLLLWTLPEALTGPQDADRAWGQYLDAWRPGKPHRQTWDAFYTRAWNRVTTFS